MEVFYGLLLKTTNKHPIFIILPIL